MTYFHTCKTCAKPQSTCQIRDALKELLQGLRVSSIKHRCPAYEPAFRPGDAVRVNTLAWFHRDEDDPPPRLDFPGYFIQMAAGKALVYVAAGTEDLNGEDVEFEPNGNGYLKVPLKRVSQRDAAPITIAQCSWCGSIPAIDKHCGRDPHYTPSASCLALTSEPLTNGEADQ